MRVAVVCLAAMGHFIPAVNLAGAIQERGHDVTVIITKFAKEKCEKYITSAGCKTLVTDDDCVPEDMTPNKGAGG